MMNRFFFLVLILFPFVSIKSQIEISLLSSNVGKEIQVIGTTDNTESICKLAVYKGNKIGVARNDNLLYVNKNKFRLLEDFNLINKQYQDYKLAISNKSTKAYIIKVSERKYLVMEGNIIASMGNWSDCSMIIVFDIAKGIKHKSFKKWVCIAKDFDIKNFNDDNKDGFLDLKYKDDSGKEKKSYTFR
jgi:hypothetical protein